MLLGTIAFIIGLTQPVFEVFGKGFSWRDLILIAGGLFLLTKATWEIHDKIEGASHEESPRPLKKASFGMLMVQIIRDELGDDAMIADIGNPFALPMSALTALRFGADLGFYERIGAQTFNNLRVDVGGAGGTWNGHGRTRRRFRIRDSRGSPSRSGCCRCRRSRHRRS